MQTELNLNLDPEYASLISQFTSLNAQLNSFINGTSETTIVTNAGTIKSLSGIVAALNEFHYVQKIIDIQTYAAMISDDLNIENGMLIRVYGDTILLNGIYSKVSTGVYTLVNYSSLYGLSPSNQNAVILSYPYTLIDQTAAQPLFNNSPTGAVTLPVGTYEFECVFSLSGLASGTNTFGFDLVSGTSVLGSQSWIASATVNSATQDTVSYNTAPNTALATPQTGTGGYTSIKGIFTVTTAGTLIPSVSLSQASAAVVGINSRFKCNQINSNTVGNWS